MPPPRRLLSGLRMSARDDLPFGELIRSRTGASFMARDWLTGSVERALAAGKSLVQVTGKPGIGKTGLGCELDR